MSSTSNSIREKFPVSKFAPFAHFFKRSKIVAFAQSHLSSVSVGARTHKVMLRLQ